MTQSSENRPSLRVRQSRVAAERAGAPPGISQPFIDPGQPRIAGRENCEREKRGNLENEAVKNRNAKSVLTPAVFSSREALVGCVEICELFKLLTHKCSGDFEIAVDGPATQHLEDGSHFSLGGAGECQRQKAGRNCGRVVHRHSTCGEIAAHSDKSSPQRSKLSSTGTAVTFIDNRIPWLATSIVPLVIPNAVGDFLEDEFHECIGWRYNEGLAGGTLGDRWVVIPLLISRLLSKTIVALLGNATPSARWVKSLDWRSPQFARLSKA